MACDFSASQLLTIKLKAEEMWTGAQALDLTPNAAAAQAVLAQQTARIAPLESTTKDNQVTITWISACDVVAEDCGDDCDITEPPLCSNSKDYPLNVCKKTGFSIDEEMLRTNTYGMQEIAARGIAACGKALDEFWAQYVLTQLELTQGVNVAPQPYTFNAGEKHTEVPTADYTNKLVPYLLKTGTLNKISPMYFIDSGALYTDWLNAQFEAGNLDGKGSFARTQAINLYFDMFNFGTAGVDENTFLIGKNAVALATTNRFTAAPRVVGGQVGQTLYTIPSPSLQGVNYDVIYTIKCQTVNGKAHYVDTWRVETRGGFFTNPYGCPVIGAGSPPVADANANTGVLGFKAV